jgi:hypothetical protein
VCVCVCACLRACVCVCAGVYVLLLQTTANTHTFPLFTLSYSSSFNVTSCKGGIDECTRFRHTFGLDIRLRFQRCVAMTGIQTTTNNAVLGYRFCNAFQHRYHAPDGAGSSKTIPFSLRDLKNQMSRLKEYGGSLPTMRWEASLEYLFDFCPGISFSTARHVSDPLLVTNPSHVQLLL